MLLRRIAETGEEVQTRLKGWVVCYLVCLHGGADGQLTPTVENEGVGASAEQGREGLVIAGLDRQMQRRLTRGGACIQGGRIADSEEKMRQDRKQILAVSVFCVTEYWLQHRPQIRLATTIRNLVVWSEDTRSRSRKYSSSRGKPLAPTCIRC